MQLTNFFDSNIIINIIIKATLINGDFKFRCKSKINWIVYSSFTLGLCVNTDYIRLKQLFFKNFRNTYWPHRKKSREPP